MTTIYYGKELYHFGTKGQKWGVRRYQNQDGSYKSGSEGRYDPDQTPKKTSKIKQTAKKVAIGAVKGAAIIGVTAATVAVGAKLIKSGKIKMNLTPSAGLKDLGKIILMNKLKGKAQNSKIGKLATDIHEKFRKKSYKEQLFNEIMEQAQTFGKLYSESDVGEKFAKAGSEVADLIDTFKSMKY